jgi:hypothetical protein
MALPRLYVTRRGISVFRSDKIGGRRWWRKSGTNAFATLARQHHLKTFSRATQNRLMIYKLRVERALDWLPGGVRIGRSSNRIVVIAVAVPCALQSALENTKQQIDRKNK